MSLHIVEEGEGMGSVIYTEICVNRFGLADSLNQMIENH